MTDDEYAEYRHQKSIDEGGHIPAFMPSSREPAIAPRRLGDVLDEIYNDTPRGKETLWR